MSIYLDVLIGLSNSQFAIAIQVYYHIKQDHVDLWKLKGPRLCDKELHARRRRYLLLHGNLLKAVSNHGKSTVLMKGNYEHAKLLNAV